MFCRSLQHHFWNAWWIWNSNVYWGKLGLLLDSMMIWSSHSIFILLCQPCYPVFPWYIYSSPISVDSFYLEQRKWGSISFSVEQKIEGSFYSLLGTWSRFNVGLLFYVGVFLLVDKIGKICTFFKLEKGVVVIKLLVFLFCILSQFPLLCG